VQASIKTQRPFWQKYPLEQSTFKQLFTETHWPFLHVWLAWQTTFEQRLTAKHFPP
jgi:hypothetical protein